MDMIFFLKVFGYATSWIMEKSNMNQVIFTKAGLKMVNIMVMAN